MENRFARTGRLLGENAMERLVQTKVTFFGLGGRTYDCRRNHKKSGKKPAGTGKAGLIVWMDEKQMKHIIRK